MTEQLHPSGAVFLSYASQDVDAASRICETLREAGIEVWFDRSELRGGDAWDSQIKKQIHDCALFVPLISAHTNARSEGYFRGEWHLATRRLHNMADDAAFLVPVVVDDTREAGARVPEEFFRAQWTWLPGGETPPTFAHRVRQLLGEDNLPVHHSPTTAVGEREPSARIQTAARLWLQSLGLGRHRARNGGIALAALLLVLGGGAFWYYQGSKKAPAVIGDPVAKFSPPAHSVAVLAFTNMSGDPKDEYFSDGLSEELLNTLVRIDKLQVAARTSSFSFKGTAVDIPTVGRKLNVGAVLEGSVRKAGERVRITAQLINTVTGYHLWSQSFDRELDNILSLQTEIATAVAGALKVVLLGEEKKHLSDGGTKNPKAFDAFLRAENVFSNGAEETNLRAAVASYDEAIRADPNYALAYAHRGEALSTIADTSVSSTKDRDELVAQARSSAYKAIELAPTSGRVYASLAIVLTFTGNDYAAIDTAYRRGLELEPGNVNLLSEYARLAAGFGRPNALDAANRAVELNPLTSTAYASKGIVLFFLRRYDEARESLVKALRLQEDAFYRTWLGTVEIAAGRPAAALPHCEPHKQAWDGQTCLAIAYQHVGRKREAATILQQMNADYGDTLAFQYAEIYSQWGQKREALEWLATALRLQDSGLVDINADPLLDPIRDEPQFKQIVGELNFPK